MPLLPGHGTRHRRHARHPVGGLVRRSQAAYTELAARSDAVVVVGLSMGGLLAVWLAEFHPEIAALAVVNPLLSPPDEGTVSLVQAMIDDGDEVAPGIGSDIAMEGAVESAYPGLPPRPRLSLFAAAAEVEARAPHRSAPAPCSFFTSVQDHVVDPRRASSWSRRQGPGRAGEAGAQLSRRDAGLRQDEIEARTGRVRVWACSAAPVSGRPDGEAAPVTLSREDVVHVAPPGPAGADRGGGRPVHRAAAHCPRLCRRRGRPGPGAPRAVRRHPVREATSPARRAQTSQDR